MDLTSQRLFMGSSAGGDSYWIFTIGNNSDTDIAESVTSDSSDNIIFAGTQGGKAWNVKLDKDGDVQWQKTLSSTYGYQIRGIVCDSTDSYITVGYSPNTTSTYDGGNVFKRDSSGTVSWQRILEHTVNSDQFTSIAVDSSDNVYICGTSSNGATAAPDLHYAKYNSSGTIQYQRTLRDTNRVEGQGISVDSSGNVYTLATFYNGSYYDLIVAQHNSSAVNVWQYDIGYTIQNLAYHQAVDSSGNTYNLGRVNTGVGNHLYIAKFNSSGTVQWQRTLGGATGTTTTTPGEVALDSDGNVYVTAVSNASGSQRGVIAKYNNSGVLQWQRYLQGPGNTFFKGITIDSQDNVIAVGEAVLVNTDALVFKLPNDGSLTGTYGSWTYDVETLSDASVSYSSSATTLSNTVGGLAGSTSSFTDAASTESSTLTSL